MASSAFRAVSLFLVSLALCQGALAARDVPMTPAEQIRGVFVEVTALSNTLRIEAEKIDGDPIQAFAVLSFTVAPGFSQITLKVSAATAMITSMPTTVLGAADAKTVVVALTEFVKVHQALLSVVIGEQGLLARIPLLSPVREALVALEAAVDSFAFALIAVIPTEEEAATAQFAALKVTVVDAQNAYKPPLGLKLPVVPLPKFPLGLP